MNQIKKEVMIVVTAVVVAMKDQVNIRFKNKDNL